MCPPACVAPGIGGSARLTGLPCSRRHWWRCWWGRCWDSRRWLRHRSRLPCWLCSGGCRGGLKPLWSGRSSVGGNRRRAGFPGRARRGCSGSSCSRHYSGGNSCCSSHHSSKGASDDDPNGRADTDGLYRPVLPVANLLHQAPAPRVPELRGLVCGILRGHARDAVATKIVVLEPLEAQALGMTIDSATSADDWVPQKMPTSAAWCRGLSPAPYCLLSPWAHNPRDGAGPSG